MKARAALLLSFCLLASLGGRAVAAPTPHGLLQELCDDFGGRMTGTPANQGAMDRLAKELTELGYKPELRTFKMPGWERRDDRATITAPITRQLRIAALSYSHAHMAFEAPVVNIGNGRVEDYPKPVGTVAGKIGLLASGTPLQMREIVANAVEQKLRGILFVNREGGGQLLARTGSFTGEALPLPVYSVTQEEGRWIERILARGTEVKVRMDTKSRRRMIETANLHVRIEGRRPSRLVVGAHVDSWDLGQGAMDNGLGVAQLFAVALAFRGVTPEHTVELIWFNGEEQGLFGSRQAAGKIGATPIVAMVNLDMVGVPIAVNALGDDTLVPALERWHATLPQNQLPKGVENINWAASDHTPYQLAGIRAITFNAPIPRESVRYYHDLADTIDKVSPQLVDDSSAIIVSLVRALANDATLDAWRRSPEETANLFTRFGLDRRLRGMGLKP